MKQLIALLFLSLTVWPVAAFGQTEGETADKPMVYVFEIKGDIDPRMNRRVKLALEEATQKEADMIIVHMDTYGGAVNDADDIRTMILESAVPTHVFIDKDAASAGALIAIASDSIYMAPGASIGAGALTPQRHATAMAHAPVGANVHQALDVHRNFTPKVTLDPNFLINDLAQPVDFIVRQVADSRVRADLRPLQQLLAGVQPNAVDIRQPNLNPLFARQVNSGDTCHRRPGRW